MFIRNKNNVVDKYETNYNSVAGNQHEYNLFEATFI